MATMNALRAHHRGGPEVLVYETAPMPHPGPQEVLVRVHAASITFDDLTWEATWTRGGVDRTPIIPSHEVSGTVAAAPEPTSREFAVGDGVYGLIPFDRDGAAAEYVAVPANCLAGKPTTADHVHTSALPWPASTAWQALVERPRPGERVLVQGATGGVGGFVTQIAAHLGGDVTASVRESQSLDIARRYGAHNVWTRQPMTSATTARSTWWSTPSVEPASSYRSLCSVAAGGTSPSPHRLHRTRPNASASRRRSSSSNPTPSNCATWLNSSTTGS